MKNSQTHCDYISIQMLEYVLYSLLYCNTVYRKFYINTTHVLCCSPLRSLMSGLYLLFISHHKESLAMKIFTNHSHKTIRNEAVK